MKVTPMKKIISAVALVASLVSASAQFSTPPTGVNAEMLKLFGDTKAFSAKATARLLDKDQKETLTMPLTMALRDGKLRSE
jgi:outer membrane lipoprotein-sorting protein